MNRTPILPLAVCIVAAQAFALDIEGVQMAAMDQPRVTVILRRTPGGPPLAGKSDPAMAKMLGLDKEIGDTTSAFAAFLDTGAGGICISTQTADSLGIKRQTFSNRPGDAVIFHDVGVGGTDQFYVSEPLSLELGAYQALGLAADSGTFQFAGGPWYTQVGPIGGGGLLSELVGPMDVVGMPVMAGKAVIMDVRPVNSFSDTIRVQLVDPRAPGVSIPQTQRHVALSYGNFGPFTTIEPANAHRPVVTANPMIGRAPVAPGDKSAAKNITLRHAGRQSDGAWLLDTGAAASMISKKQAAALGITYKPGTEGTPMPELLGVPKARQFTLTVGGIGGQKKSAGFFVDELRVPTAEGDDLVYKAAPVLVADITVEHPQTHDKITLDGVFGMNFLVATAAITEGLAPDMGKMSEGAFDFVIIDHTKGILALALRPQLLGAPNR